MKEKQVIREVMSLRGWSQATLAEKAGFKTQSNITGILNRGKNGIRVDHLIRMLNAMGCELVARDIMGSKKEWIIDLRDEKEEQ